MSATLAYEEKNFLLSKFPPMEHINLPQKMEVDLLGFSMIILKKRW